MRFFLTAVAVFGIVVPAGCGGSSSNGALAGDASGTPDSGGSDAGAPDARVKDAGTTDADGGLSDVVIRKPAPPQFKDWTCPEGWLPTPAFADENGVENPPEGVAQFSICKPPDDWNPAKPPVFQDWECPPGWLPAPGFTDENGAENPPEGVAQFQICMPPEVPECPDGEVAYVGETACHLIGTECPADDFHDEATIKGLAPNFNGKIIYALAGGVGGDGSVSNPFGKIADAIAAAASGDMIALSKGTFLEGVSVNKAVALVGSCVGGTVIEAQDANANAGVITDVAGGTSKIANLRVAGNRIGIWVFGSSQKKVSLQSVEVKGALIEGVLFARSKTEADMKDVVVRDTRSRTADATWGYGVEVSDGARVTGARVVLERNRTAGIWAYGTGTALALNDVLVRGTMCQEADGSFGHGVDVFDGAVVSLTRSLVEGNAGAGVAALTSDVGQPAPSLTLDHVVVRATKPREADRTQGTGLQVRDGAKVVVTRGVFERNMAIGINVVSSQTGQPVPELTLDDVVVRGTESQEADLMGGFGLSVAFGARLFAERLVVDGNRMGGVAAADGPGSRLSEVSLADVVVRDTRGQELDGAFGRGLDLADGPVVSVERAILERNRDAGIVAYVEMPGAPPPVLMLTDVLVRDTLGQERGEPRGRGMEVLDGATAGLTRVVFERNRDIGITAEIRETGRPPPEITLTDVVVRDTLGHGDGGTDGKGFMIADGATVEAARTMISLNRGAGIQMGVSQPGRAAPVATFTDLSVTDTSGQEGDGKFGAGLYLQSGGKLDIIRALFERNRSEGIITGVSGPSPQVPELTMTDVIVRDTMSKASEPTFGRGLDLERVSKVSLVRGVFDRNREAGIAIVGGAGEASVDLSCSDVVVRGTRSQEYNGYFGHGLSVLNAATVSVDRGLFEGNRHAGITASIVPGYSPPVVTLADVTVRGTKSAECAGIPEGDTGSCITGGVAYGGGTGFGVYEGASVTLQRFDIHSNEQCGIQIARDGKTAAAEGAIHDNPIGLNVQIEGYDLTTVLSPTVRVYDNDTNVDAKELPVPDPVAATEELQ
ncbi:MAG: right-handed parallel beta-helix repeat-containing protein [Deltaproteobacteria bacterium]|nr:right-handed parallel beta-helix repeat-containing protein [Deltaproteobacteria bacterium]